MKIALIHLNLSTESGDPRMFFSIVQGLRRLGHEVIVYTAEFDRDNCFPNLNRDLDIRVVPPRSPLEPAIGTVHGLIGRIVERIRRNRVRTDAARRIGAVLPNDLDILVCQNDQSYYLGRTYRRRNPRARIVWIMNNPPFYSAPKTSFLVKIASIMISLWEKAKVRYYLQGIDVVVVHDKERKKMIGALGVSAALLPIPVDFEAFYQPVKVRQLLKSVTLLSVGALSPPRKFEDTIRAGMFLRRKGYDARVIVVCKDFWNDRGYRETLLRITEEASMTPYVDFKFEGVSEEGLRLVYRASDVFVFPQHINIWGMSAFEAMAAGLPLIVSRATSVVEVLRDGHNAFFVDPGQPEEIAAKVELLVGDPRLYDRIAREGQSFVKNNLSWDKYVRDFFHITVGQKL